MCVVGRNKRGEQFVRRAAVFNKLRHFDWTAARAVN